MVEELRAAKAEILKLLGAEPSDGHSFPADAAWWRRHFMIRTMRRVPPSNARVAHAGNGVSLETIARALGLRRAGREFTGKCPSCGYASGFSITERERRAALALPCRWMFSIGSMGNLATGWFGTLQERA